MCKEIRILAQQLGLQSCDRRSQVQLLKLTPTLFMKICT